MEKEKIYEFEIIDNGASFEGIAKYDGKVVFIPGAIIGEKVRAKVIKITKDYAIAKLENIVIKSGYRNEPFCEVYHRCGGCLAQHIEYNMQLLLKSKMVNNLLTKQKVQFEKVENTIGMGMPYYYRNKVQYPVRMDQEGNTTLGFYAKRSHHIVENKCCYIQNRVIDMLAKDLFQELVGAGLKGYNEETGEGDIRHIIVKRGVHTQEILITIVVNQKDLLNDLRFVQIANLMREKNENILSIYLNLNESRTNEILGDTLKHIAGEKYISEYIGNLRYFIGPKSFFQVNTLQAEILYTTLKENLMLNKNDIVFDLYSGVGSIGLYLSDSVAKVYGIEIEEEAVALANLNMLENHVLNAEYIAGSVEQKMEEFAQRKICPDVIVVDPPRKGLDLQSIEYIFEFHPQKIGYVSCNPATLARDLKLLEKNYVVTNIIPVDMFPQTSSVECVAILIAK